MMRGVSVARAATEVNEPFMTPSGQEGSVYWVRESGSDGIQTRTALWQSDAESAPESLEITLGEAETYLVLRGRMEIYSYADDERLSLGEGDIVTFERGTRMRLTRLEPVLKTLMVISG